MKNIDSILHQYKSSYYRLPQPIQTFLGELYGQIPLEIRFGKNYPKHRDILEKFYSSSEQFQLDYMYNKTYETLQFAYDNLPYYRKLFDKHDFKIKDFKSFDDYKKVPYLTKEDILNNLSDMHTNKVEKEVSIKTGGTSMKAMEFFIPRELSRAKEKAYFLHVFKQLKGYKYRAKTLAFRTIHVDNSEPRPWVHEAVDNYLFFERNFTNDPKNIHTILEQIHKFQAKFINAYPSRLYQFIQICKKNNINEISNIKGIILTSEGIPDYYFHEFKNFFKCNIIAQYGHSERICAAYNLNQEEYKFLNSYGLSESINNEIVGTSFDNFVMPFIRYKTNDFISGEKTFFKDTNIIKTTQYIDGRLQEYLVTKNRTLILFTKLASGSIANYKYVDAIQFYQDTPGYITIYIQTKEPKKINHQEILSLAKKMSNQFEYKVQTIDEIARTSIGKFKHLVQKLDITKYMAN